VDTLMDIAIVVSGLNSIVLVALLYFYGRLAIRSKAPQSLGLVVFALFLLCENLLTIFSYESMAPLFGTPTIPYLLGVAALQLVALVALLRFTV
jgi:hypothetical protein